MLCVRLLALFFPSVLCFFSSCSASQHWVENQVPSVVRKYALKHLNVALVSSGKQAAAQKQTPARVGAAVAASASSPSSLSSAFSPSFASPAMDLMDEDKEEKEEKEEKKVLRPRSFGSAVDLSSIPSSSRPSSSSSRRVSRLLLPGATIGEVDVDYALIYQYFCFIVAAGCFAIGLKFAGEENEIELENLGKEEEQ